MLHAFGIHAIAAIHHLYTQKGVCVCVWGGGGGGQRVNARKDEEVHLIESRGILYKITSESVQISFEMYIFLEQIITRPLKYYYYSVKQSQFIERYSNILGCFHCLLQLVNVSKV